MSSIASWLFHDGQFLGIDWSFWKAVGWLGNLIFFSRFLVQWFSTERNKKVVIPVAFWWLSLGGSLLLLLYAIVKRDSVFIFAYGLTWLPYIRNLVIHKRYQEWQVACSQCAHLNAPDAKFCNQCGNQLAASKAQPA